jgi:hypothetical protein
MNTEALFLFLILLLGLVLCSFLGGNCGNEGFTGEFSGTITSKEAHDNKKNGASTNGASTNGASTSSNVSYDNYNHFNGLSTQLVNGTTFYGDNGGSVVVNIDSNGQQILQVILENGQQPMAFLSQKQSSIVTESYTNYSGNSGTYTIFYGPNGAIATVVNADNGQQAINVETPSGSYLYIPSGSNPDNITSTQYYGSTGTPIQSSDSSLAYDGPYSDYYNSLPHGIPRSQIPLGKEDLYILKSQIVPPVFPVGGACPVASTYPTQEKCPPCPACARCPEPSFECKKVPNYNAIESEKKPEQVLKDYSTFGM